MRPPITRWIILLLGLIVSGQGQEVGKIPTELMAALRERYSFSALPVPDRQPAAADEESILHLDTFRVTALPSFDHNLLEAAQRAARLREAEEFSPQRGGLIFSTRLGLARLDLGIWPSLETRQVGALKNDALFLRVEVLRLTW